MNRLLQKIGMLAFAILCSTAVGYGQVYVNGNASGANDGSSWENAYTNLQTALDSASAGDEIWVAAGTYTNGAAGEDAFHIETGVTLLGGFAGTETSADERDPSANPVILSGDLNGDDQAGVWDMGRDDNSRRVVLVDTLAEGTVFDGFTVSGGNALFVDSTARLSFGGGLLAFQNVRIENCTFTDNRAARGAGATIAGINTTGFRILNSTFESNFAISGGAAYLVGAAAGLVEGCDFSTNIADEASGGFGGAILQLSLIDTIRNCTFFGNDNINGLGGGIYTQDAFNLIEGCLFESNNAFRGAGFFAAAPNEDVEAVVRDCEFVSNTTDGQGSVGGAVCIGTSGGDYDFIDCIFENNSTAASVGGAVFTFQFNSTDFFGCEFNRNSSPGGGGAVLAQASDVYFEDCIFESNSTMGRGGAVYTSRFSIIQNPVSEFVGCVFQENEGTELGGAVYHQVGGENIYTNCQFIENQSESFGGAIFAGFGDADTLLSMVVNTTSFTSNTAGGAGGAIHIQNTFEFSADSSTFTSNQSPSFGGAINFSGDEAFDMETISLSRTTFIGNIAQDEAGEAGQGGAINVFDGPISLVNSIFAFNAVGIDGIGGALSHNIDTTVTSRPVTLINNTFYQNTGDLGSHYAQWSRFNDPNIRAEITMQNNIFAAGNGGTAFELESSAEMTPPNFVSNGGNLFFDESIMQYAVAEDQMNVADFGLTDPDNALDFSLADGSVAIDAGVNDGAPLVDILDSVRLDIGGDQVDAGAHERDLRSSTNLLSTNEFDVTIAPSVTSDIINVSFTDSEAGEVRVLVVDYQGKVVMDRMEEKGPSLFRATYNVGNLTQGAYILRVITENGSVSGGRFVVTK